ncbi:MAG: hypothetical protein HQ515_15700 [Phycisphaeraceae bacterium]|nr:hypothetical protein [Phycisphaeraceae bacterium]
MSRANSIIVAILFLAAFVSTAGAATTVTQVGDQLSVIGDDTDDSVYIYQIYYYDYWTWVYDDQTGIGDWYYGVNQVVVDTGNGSDYVNIYDYWSGYWYGGSADVQVLTGNEDDSVDIYDEGGRSFIDVSTENGQDSVSSTSSYTYYYGYGGGIALDTGNGKDEVYANSYADVLNIALANGNDVISGYASDSYGALDGGNGKDTCSGLAISGGSLAVTNCEK